MYGGDRDCVRALHNIVRGNIVSGIGSVLQEIQHFGKPLPGVDAHVDRFDIQNHSAEETDVPHNVVTKVHLSDFEGFHEVVHKLLRV